jgi:hypothetical protein
MFDFATAWLLQNKGVARSPALGSVSEFVSGQSSDWEDWLHC